MLFRATHERIPKEGPWWAYPSIAAIFTVFAVGLACALIIGPAAPLEISVVRTDGGGFEVGPEPDAATVSPAPEPADALEIRFAAPAARGEDLFVSVKGAPSHAWLNGAPPVSVRLGRSRFPGTAVKPDGNRLLIEPEAGILSVTVHGYVARSVRPFAAFLRGGPSRPASPPSGLAILIAAAFAAIVVFALLTCAPGRALARTGALLIGAVIAVAVFNAASGHRLFLSGSAAATLGAIPLALVSAGTLVREKPALRVFLALFAIYAIGIPFHVATPIEGLPAPLPHYLGVAFNQLWHLELPPAGIEIASTLIAAAIAAAGGLALHRAALRLFSAPAANLALVLYAFGTSIFSTTTQDLHGHGIAALGIALALYGFARASEPVAWHFDLLAGVGLGIALAARLPAGIAGALALAGVLFARPRRLGAVLAGLLPFAGLVWLDQMTRFGSPLATAYGPLPALPGALSVPGGEAIAGLLLSPSRGLFVYSPGLLLAVLGVARFARRADGPTIGLAFFPLALVLLLAARGAGWAGGSSYGPRLLTESLPPLALLVAAGVDHLLVSARLRAPAWVLVGLSVAMQLPHFFFPNEVWNLRYAGNIEAAAWRAPELQVQVHLEHAAGEIGIR